MQSLLRNFSTNTDETTDQYLYILNLDSKPSWESQAYAWPALAQFHILKMNYKHFTYSPHLCTEMQCIYLKQLPVTAQSFQSSLYVFHLVISTFGKFGHFYEILLFFANMSMFCKFGHFSMSPRALALQSAVVASRHRSHIYILTCDRHPCAQEARHACHTRPPFKGKLLFSTILREMKTWPFWMT